MTPPPPLRWHLRHARQTLQRCEEGCHPLRLSPGAGRPEPTPYPAALRRRLPPLRLSPGAGRPEPTPYPAALRRRLPRPLRLSPGAGRPEPTPYPAALRRRLPPPAAVTGCRPARVTVPFQTEVRHARRPGRRRGYPTQRRVQQVVTQTPDT